MQIFRNRLHAGQLLAKALRSYANRPDVLVLALPRGGIPVAFEVAKALKAPLDIFVVRKLGVPGHDELAMGAIASGGIQVLNQDVVDSLGIITDMINQVVSIEQKELERREKTYRQGRPTLEIKGKHIIIVDDGLATGATMTAAIQALKAQNPEGITIAIPVAPQDTIQGLQKIAPEVVCLFAPEVFSGVGIWYQDFSQTTDDEVRKLLCESEEIYRMNFPQENPPSITTGIF